MGKPCIGEGRLREDETERRNRRKSTVEIHIEKRRMNGGEGQVREVEGEKKGRSKDWNERRVKEKKVSEAKDGMDRRKGGYRWET